MACALAAPPALRLLEATTLAGALVCGPVPRGTSTCGPCAVKLRARAGPCRARRAVRSPSVLAPWAEMPISRPRPHFDPASRRGAGCKQFPNAEDPLTSAARAPSVSHCAVPSPAAPASRAPSVRKSPRRRLHAVPESIGPACFRNLRSFWSLDARCRRIPLLQVAILLPEIRQGAGCT